MFKGFKCIVGLLLLSSPVFCITFTLYDALLVRGVLNRTWFMESDCLFALGNQTIAADKKANPI
jgi:hypothetical protein